MPTSRQSLPMYFPAAPFSLNDAVICSALVNAAYDMYSQWAAQGSPSNPSKFKWTKPTGPIIPNGPILNYQGPIWGVPRMLEIHYPEPFAFLAWDASGKTYIAFRGSETAADFWEDAAMGQVSYDPIVAGFGQVHDGFNDVYTRSYTGLGYSVFALRTTLLSYLGKLSYKVTAFYVTGHSLGAGLSTISAPDVVRNSAIGKLQIPIFHYSLASPRVGNPDFAYNSNFQIPVKTFRIANTEDLVPDGPLAVDDSTYYEHVGTPVDFTTQYDSIGGNHDHLNCYYYALTHPNQPQGPIVSGTDFGSYSESRASVSAARERYEQLK